MKKKKRGIRRAIAVIAFILLTSIAFLSAVFTLETIDSQIYRNSQEETAADFQEHIGSYLAAEIFSDFVNYDIEDARSFAYSLADETNFNFYVFKKSVDTSVERICTIENGNLASVIPEYMAIVGNYDSYCYPGISIDVLNSPEQIFTEVEEQDANLSRGDIYAVAFFPLGDLTYHDDLYFKMKYIDFAYKVRYAIFAVLAGSTIGAVILLVTLVRTAGKKDEEGRIQKSFIDKIPLELYGLMLYIVEAGVAGFFGNIWGFYGTNIGSLAAIVILAVLTATLLLALLMSCSVRHKTKTLWSNTLLCRFVKWLKQALSYIKKHMPFIYKGVVIALGIIFIEFIGILILEGSYNWEGIFLVFLVEKAALFLIFCIILANLNQLKQGGEKIAEGDYDYQMDTSHMRGEFKNYAEHLNQIGSGMQTALDERMKSEHFKTELITNVSHDIKTPLTSIINYVDLLTKEDVENPKVQEYLEVLTRQSARLKKLIEDLIEASKASSGVLKVNWEKCVPEVLLTQAAGEYEERLEQKNLELVIHHPQEELVVLADGRHLWRVFDNLLSNIYKYAQPGTRVYLDLEQDEKNVSIIFRNVSKNPLHMSGEELQERFVRGDSSRNTEGSGLGLSIAKNLVELMGGSISCQSKKGVGTTFTVSLPLAHAVDEKKQKAEETGEGEAEEDASESYDFGGRRILLAEDTEMNAEIVTELLELVNMHVDHAWNGEEAVERYMESAPGTYMAVLMDVQMPGMNGYEAAKAIRAQKSSRPDAGEIPIYAMTANAYTEDISAALNAGMNGHIAKPVDTAALYRLLKKSMEETG